MAEIYQNLPTYIDPVAFAVGSFSVRWYSLMYLAAFLIVYLILILRIRIGEGEIEKKGKTSTQGLVSDWMIYSVAGLLVGARLGHVILYNFGYYLENPLAIIFPTDPASGKWTGIMGMSYYGGLVGTVLASIWFVRKKRIGFQGWADFVVPAIPAGYFFGRIGNFLNGELYGRPASSPWGMNFGDGLLRHPTQLYEAFFEGAILFVFLWYWRRRIFFRGENLLRYLIGYGVIRFWIEFLRENRALEPDWIGLDLSQFLSLFVIIVSLALYHFWSRGYNKKEVMN